MSHYKPGEVPPLLDHPHGVWDQPDPSESNQNQNSNSASVPYSYLDIFGKTRRRASLRLVEQEQQRPRTGVDESRSSYGVGPPISAGSSSSRVLSRNTSFKARLSMMAASAKASASASVSASVSTGAGAIGTSRKRRLSGVEDDNGDEYPTDVDEPSVSDDEGARVPRKRMRRESDWLESVSTYIPKASIPTPPPAPPPALPSPPHYLTRDPRDGFALMRSASLTSIHSNTPKQPSDRSALYKMKDWGMSIPFSIPDTLDTNAYLPLTISFKNNMYFTRGNRVHVKPWSRQSNHNQDITQICRVEEKYGEVKLLGCSKLKEEVVIVTTKGTGNSFGTVFLVDVEASNKPTWSWRASKPIGAVEWHGNLVTVGTANDGMIKFYDVRTRGEGGKFSVKMKSDSRRLTRHQGRITKLGWNKTGQVLASGDENGVVYCWDDRTKVPLEVGDASSRRKKMKHQGAVSALTWHPMEPNTLGTADTSGVVRFWNINAKQTDNRRGPGSYELDSRVVNIHFSPDFKDEFITVQGRSTVVHHSLPTASQVNTANSLVALTFPQINHVVGKGIFEADNSNLNRLISIGVAGPSARPYLTERSGSDYSQPQTGVLDKEVTGSVMINGGTKVVVAVPKEGSLKVWDVWGKHNPKDPETKQLRRRSSLRLDRL